tara:strand:+ start:1343 stop:1846 length:504 start_codon:yes stop_codon:yes gene_type:complete
MIRLSVVILPLVAVALSACTPSNTPATPPSASEQVQRLAVMLDATASVDFPNEQTFTRVTANPEIAPGEVYRLSMDDLSATTFDLGQVGSGARLDLVAAVMASALEGGDILFEVTLTTQGDGDSESQVVATPRLLVREGEIATVHIGQDAGDFQAGFTLDLQASPVP